ncbi:hypothetical protein [Flavobacterium pectinovorum]|uniref:Uncharacterized protein n=1 Tax=Flavobacterium pectinovorum TaxID=29533 RepID=A0A502EMU4_9FLAO|nr:hypothetical protein [Flavobacterium pectinovorum]TPG38394.1 hypothetical protein EAH81_15810 [Flavobacterium pectinovorum]
MKKIIIIIMLLSVTSYGQNAFQDAKKLNRIRVAELEKKLGIITSSAEFATYKNKEDLENFQKFLLDPFNPKLAAIDVSLSLGNILEMETIMARKVGGVAGQFDTDGDGVADKNDACPNEYGTFANYGCPDGKDAKTLVPPTGQDMTTVLVDALAQFLVDRVKQELTITFYENFRKKLKDTIEIKVTIEGKAIVIKIELRVLFPNTFLLLDSKEYFDTPSLGKTWVTAFKKDLINLPSQLEIIVRSNTDLATTDVGSFTLISFDVIEQVKRGDHPMEILDNINTKYTSGMNFKTLSQQLVGFINLISSNLTYLKGDGDVQVKTWAISDDLQKLDDTSKKFLAGLVYQKGVQSKLFDKIVIGSKTLTGSITKDNYPSFYSHIQQMSGNFKTITALLDRVKSEMGKETTTKTLEQYAVYLTAFYNLFDENMKAIYQILGSNTYYDSFYFKSIRPVSEDLIGFNSALAQKNYAECILLSTNLLQQLFYSEVDSDTSDKKVIKEFFYYSNFLADIIAASESGNSENVKKIVENYAMPVGSYRIKRSYSHSWDISAFPGLYLGYEFDSSQSMSYGITAPVGISFSRKHNRKVKDSSCSTFFLSVIDIGAPFSYRFTNDDAQGLPQEIKWEQIFSPGFFYIYGFKNTPISLSLGGQFTPLLRDIEDDKNVLKEENVFRLSLGLMVDIPIFNLKKGKLK